MPSLVLLSSSSLFLRYHFLLMARSFHLKRRREDDIAIVTCCFSVTLEDEKAAPKNGVKSAKVVRFTSAFGGIAPVTRQYATGAELYFYFICFIFIFAFLLSL
jgi:hypothetical protein